MCHRKIDNMDKVSNQLVQESVSEILDDDEIEDTVVEFKTIKSGIQKKPICLQR